MAQTVVENEVEVVEAETDAASDDTEAKKNADVVEDTFEAVWDSEANGDGQISGQISGTFRFIVHEGKDEQGMPVYTSSLFRNPQDELQTALTLCFKNAAGRAFKRTWDVLFPPEERARVSREKQAEKIARLSDERDQEKAAREIAEAQAQVLADALSKNQQPDFEAAGLPIPEYWANAMAAKSKK